MAKPTKVNYGFAIVGWLAHDALLFDRQCPACGNMVSSYEHRVCPKCNGELGFMTTSSGDKMSIMECTLYPNFNDATKQRNAESLKARKGAVPITYRFKAFGFSKDDALAPPNFFHDMKKGALVKVTTYNHELLATPFTRRNGAAAVELMVQVFAQFGDSFEVLVKGKAAEHHIDEPGTRATAESAPVVPDNTAPEMAHQSAPSGEFAAMKKEIDELKAMVYHLAGAKSTAPAASGPVDPTPPAEDDEASNPFEGVVNALEA